MRFLRPGRNLLIRLALIGFVAASAHAAVSLRQKARAIEWTSRNIQSLYRLIPNHRTATAFVREFYPNSIPAPNVGEYAFINFGPQEGGVLYLATLDWSGQAFYTTIFIVRNQDGQLAAQAIHTGGASVENLADSVVDLNHNGQKEILVPRLLGPYEGAQPVPVIPDVYLWNNSRWEKDNEAFKDYYAGTVLPRLRSRLRKLKEGQTTTGPESNARLKAVIEKEIVDVNRIFHK